uniref:Uncharacterized protein n=1 Tax=Cucumis melo TaxID=3656 RepID=A0A9I9E7N2_CUCME
MDLSNHVYVNVNIRLVIPLDYTVIKKSGDPKGHLYGYDSNRRIFRFSFHSLFKQSSKPSFNFTFSPRRSTPHLLLCSRLALVLIFNPKLPNFSPCSAFSFSSLIANHLPSSHVSVRLPSFSLHLSSSHTSIFIFSFILMSHASSSPSSPTMETSSGQHSEISPSLSLSPALSTNNATGIVSSSKPPLP